MGYSHLAYGVLAGVSAALIYYGISQGSLASTTAVAGLTALAAAALTKLIEKTWEAPKAKAEEAKARAEEIKAKAEEMKARAEEIKAKAEEVKARAELEKARAELERVNVLKIQVAAEILKTLPEGERKKLAPKMLEKLLA